LKYFSDFISEDEEQFLLRSMSDIQWKKVEMHGVVAKREVAHYGLNYTFSSRNVSETDPAPEFLKPFILKVAKKLNVSESEIAEILISHYPPGAPIGWHRDAPMFKDVMGISLANDCVMK